MTDTLTRPTLWPQQIAHLDAICKGLLGGQNRLLVQSATGTGKTVTFAQLCDYPPLAAWRAAQVLPERKRRAMLVIAHREELINQAVEKIHHANPALRIGVEQADRYASIYDDVIVASIQTLAAGKCKRLRKLAERLHFDIVIVDEAHHAAAPSYRNVLVHLSFLPPADASATEDIEAAAETDIAEMNAALSGWDAKAPMDRLLVGFTATPNRSDDVGLGCVFQSLVSSYGTRDAINDGRLVPITSWIIETSVDLSQVSVSHGEFNQRELADAVNTSRRNQIAVAAWSEYAAGKPTLAFTVTVEHAREVAEVFTNHGIAATWLSGETPRELRRQILRDFTDRKIQLIANCMVLTEGTDLPVCECILHLKPTRSAALYAQMTGRGLRTSPGKNKCVVIDLVDLAKRHTLQSAPVLYGLPPGFVAKGKDLRKIERELEELQAAHPSFDVKQALNLQHMTLEELHVRAVQADVWRVPALPEGFAAGRKLTWLKRGEEFYVVYPWDSGLETLRLSKDLLGHWAVDATIRFTDDTPSRQRTIAAGLLSPESAAEVAERWVLQDRPSTMRIVSSEAPWKKNPVSSGQLWKLKQLKVPIDKALHARLNAAGGSGLASQLIDNALGRSG